MHRVRTFERCESYRYLDGSKRRLGATTEISLKQSFGRQQMLGDLVWRRIVVSDSVTKAGLRRRKAKRLIPFRSEERRSVKELLRLCAGSSKRILCRLHESLEAHRTVTETSHGHSFGFDSSALSTPFFRLRYVLTQNEDSGVGT